MSDIKVNKSVWDLLSEEDRASIKSALVAAGSLKAEDNIIGDTSAPTFDKDAPVLIEMHPMGNFLCEAVCATAFTAATAACAKFAGPVFAGCMLAASESYNHCKSDC